ncbi:MAG TPA: hypothetical protein ENJ19_05775 [Gammaproteobacteria bacterium]|nr:hypothetical protein [Gammaproteobacteria bacterium]
MSDNKKDNQLSGEQRFHLWVMLVGRGASILMFGIKAAVAISFVLGLAHIVHAFAGRATSADLNLNIDAEGDLFVRFWSGFDEACKWAWQWCLCCTAFLSGSCAVVKRNTCKIGL